jgi:chaperonin GroEL (HSP60 family)
MIVKQLFFDQQGQNKLRNGIAKIAKAVGSTLGPRGAVMEPRRCFARTEERAR